MQLRKITTPLGLLNILALIVILSISYFTLYQDYQKSISSAQTNTRFVASLVARQAESTIDELDQLLHGISTYIELQSAEHPSHGLTIFLDEIKAYNPQIMDLLVLDDRGKITHWTGEGIAPRVKDREYARFHLESSNSSLYVGEPLISRVHSDKWFFAISKAIREDGKLEKILVAIVDIDKFHLLISSIQRPELSSLALISKDGHIISRVPGHRQHVGNKIALPYDVLYKQNSGNFDALSPFDGVERIAGYQHLHKLNITAFSTLSREEVLSDWYTLRNFIVLTLIMVFGFIYWFNCKIRRERKIIESQREQLSEQARTDELTGLYNRRYVMNKLHREYTIAKLQKSNFSLLMIDIDHFKRINDKHGHDAGDTVLKQVSETMQKVTRKNSIIGRIGGEEFLVIMPSTTIEEAAHLAERIRESVFETTISLEQTSLKCTVSIGIAGCNFDEYSYSEEMTIKHADEAMYSAKNSGRNKVVSYITSPILTSS